MIALRAACCAVWLVSVPALNAQVLDLPDRPVDAMTGTAFVESIRALKLREREDRINTEIARGNLPTWLRTMVPVRMQRRTGDREVTITFWVTPDYLAVGSDHDYFLTPMSPHLAQRIADLTRTSLPTTAMVDAIWSSASVRLGPDSIAPSAAMITVSVFADHNRMVRVRRDSSSLPFGALVAGHKKDVVLTARLDTMPRRVAIYGWHKPDGPPIQPLNTWHTTGHVDYSHGIRLVHPRILVDGREHDLAIALRDPTLAALLNDDGVMRNARYPTTWP